MVRPVSFTFNEQTAESNAFMTEVDRSNEKLQASALVSFDNFVNLLKKNKVNVIVVQDTPEPHTPDSIFPNNWISFHQSGKVILYPMEAENRRSERRNDIIEKLKETFEVKNVIDLSHFEKQDKFLEGTGSIVLDRVFKTAYACISTRTDLGVLKAWNKVMPNYKLVYFNSTDKNDLPIYHTNVMMCVGDSFAVICLESVSNHNERQNLINQLKNDQKQIVEISLEQMYSFAGNMLLIKNKQDKKLLCMSTQAYNCLTNNQIETLSSFAEILHSDITTIETVAGGSIRCMMAEIHLPEK